MPTLTATATCTAYRAVEEATGELVGRRLVTKRVGSLATLIQELAAPLVAARWTETDLETLAAGVGLDGRPLPMNGWMALRRLGWTTVSPDGVYLSDRIHRVAQEAAARTLRLALHRREIIRVVAATWPEDPSRRTDKEWAALRKALPAGTSNAEIRNRTRQIRRWRDEHDGRLPAGITELEDPPPVAPVVLLAAADSRLSTVQRVGPEAAELRIHLPLVPRPAGRDGWAWHALPVGLPETVPADATLHSPTLRVVDHRVRVDLPWRIRVPSPPRAGHTTALGLDWGVTTLLTGSVGKLTVTPSGTRVVTDGRRLRFDATGVSAKLHRLREHREHIAARRDQYAALLDGLPDPDPSGQRDRLDARHQVLTIEHERVCTRIRNLNHALAWAAARWAVDQASALGATVIYVEDLATLEARDNRKGNARLSGQVRGIVRDALKHLAAKIGIPIVTVPARGTSKFCPRCGAELAHVAAPDRPSVRGWKWAVCGSCGLSCDRDHAAAERIVARGLLGQAHTWTDHATGTRKISTTTDGNVARARRPKRRNRAARRADRPVAPERARRRRSQRRRRPPSRPKPANSNATTISHRAPDRRAAPAPTPPRSVGKRPAGQAPQTSSPRLGRGDSGSAHDPLHRPGWYRPDTGWGFHRNVTATPVLVLGTFGLAAARPRPARNA